MTTGTFIQLEDFIKNNHQNNLTKIQPKFIAIFEQLAKVGKVSATLFSAAITHKVSGKFADMHNRSNTLMHFHPNIDTRLFTAKWRYVYAIEQENIVCLHFFSRYGDLIYKVCATETKQDSQFKGLINQFTDSQQTKLPPQVIPHLTKSKYTKAIDEAKLKEHWGAMTNVHQASKIFKRYGNDQLSVYPLLGEKYARKIIKTQLMQFFKSIVAKELNVMMFARNYATVQCYVGKLNNIKYTKDHLQIVMTDFNFMLNLSKLGEIWLVTKPTDNGEVNSFSIFDKNDNEILILTDQRTRGQAENPSWFKEIQKLNIKQE